VFEEFLEQNACATVRVNSGACCSFSFGFGSSEFCTPRVSDSNYLCLACSEFCNGLREFVRPGAHLCMACSEFAVFFVNPFVQELEQLAIQDVVVKSDAIIKVPRCVVTALRQHDVWP